MPWAWDLGFKSPGHAKEERDRKRKELAKLEKEREMEEAERRKQEEDVIVDVLIDENGNLVVDEEGQYVTMRPFFMNTTEEPRFTPIPITPPPPQISDPFDPFTGNF